MRKITFLLAILVSICGFAAEVEPDAVRVTPTNGDPVVFLFTSNPEVTYTDTGATIATKGQDPVTFDFDDIQFIDFVKNDAVDDVVAPAVTLRVTQDALLISNAEAGSVLSIYSLDGRCVLNTTIPESFSVSRSELNKGVYIVTINKTAFNIIL